MRKGSVKMDSKIIGRRYGELEVLRRLPQNNSKGKAVYEVKCHKCNKVFNMNVWTLYNSRSCGCLKRAPIGHKIQRKDGYVLVKVADVESVNKKHLRYQFEHIVVMESILGRKLKSFESVHHINGKKNDNNPKNLELWASHQPSGQRPVDLLRWAREIIQLYGFDALGTDSGS